MPLKNASRSYTYVEGAPGVYLLHAIAPPGSRSIPEAFDPGEKHSFWITNGTLFELIRGEYSDAGGGSVTALEYVETSNGDDPVVWPPGQKMIVASASAADLTDMANMVESEEALILRPEERQEIRIKSDPFYWKPRGAPLFGGTTGQSHTEAFPMAPGSGYLLPRFDNVLCWGTDGSVTGPTVGVMDFRVVDPTAPLKDDYYYQSTNPTPGVGEAPYHVNGRGNEPYVGYPNGQRGMAGIGLAVRHQQERGGKVYCFNFAWNGQNSSKWKPLTGEVANLIDAQMPAMIARLRVLEPQWFAGTAPIPWDFLLLAQAEGDIFVNQPSQYADNWEETLDYWSTYSIDGGGNYTINKWFDRRYTLISMMQRTSRTVFAPKWNGQEVLQRRRKTASLVSSAGRPTFDGVHCWGNTYHEWGGDVGREQWSRGRAPVDHRLDLHNHADYKQQAVGRFTYAGTGAIGTDPGTGSYKYVGFWTGLTISKVDNEGNWVDLSYLAAGDWVTMSQLPNPNIVDRLKITGASEYDTHWAFTTDPGAIGTEIIAGTIGDNLDLSTSARKVFPKVKGVVKLSAPQAVAPGSVVDPGAGKFAINGTHAGVLICKTGSNGTPIEVGAFAAGGWIQFVKRTEPFKRYRLNIDVAVTYGAYGDKGTWWHLQTSLASMTAGFDLSTLDAEYIMTSSCNAAVQSVAVLEPQYKQLALGYPEADIPPASAAFKAHEEPGVVWEAESVSSARDRVRARWTLSEMLRRATLMISASMRLLVKGTKLQFTMVDQASGVLRHAIEITAVSGGHPVVAINGAISGGIMCVANTAPEGTVSAAPLAIVNCFNAAGIDMPSKDVVPLKSTGKNRAITPGVYNIVGVLSYTSTASKTFVFGIQGTFHASKQYTPPDGAVRNITVRGRKQLAANEEVNLYVLSPDGGTLVTVSDATFEIERRHA